MTDMVLLDIKKLLQENIGLHAETIGDSSLERAVLHRMQSVKVDSLTEYYALLTTDQEEMNELVEEVVVPETWFFRNLVPFETLAECIPDLQNKGRGNTSPFRILSVPCSTGEEPYSIAITLIEKGLSESDFQIDAVDISKRALKKARRAIYGKHSFRESAGIAYEKYFKKTHAGQQLLPIVRNHVSFIKGNILKDHISPSPEYYDIIFCRNLLIYFNRDTQKKVLDKLYSMLKANGILFVGHAETTEVGKGMFERMNIPKSFAYQKVKQGKVVGFDEIRSVETLRSIYDQLVEVTQKDLELSEKSKKVKFKSFTGKNAIAKLTSGWNKVEKLIEQGQLADAAELCESLLKTSPDDAQGYYLLGLISNLEGSAGAAESFLKKAIYLDPNHHKALGLSALLAEQRGDNDVAESLRWREGRAKKRMLE